MHRRFYFVLLIGLFIIFIQPNKINAEQRSNVDQKLLRDILITLLDPYISEGIEHYYGYRKSYSLYDAKIIDLSREEESEFSFKVKIQVNTFEAAHNPPYGKETILLEVDLDQVRVIKFNHQGDEWERKITKFYDAVLSDIQQTLHVDLTSYKKFNDKQLMFKSEKQKAFKSLANIVANIIDNELTSEINPPYKNVIYPVTFVRENQGYILFKKADGTNILLEVSKLNDHWVVVNKKSKQGKKMKNELLWYM